ncbi:RNA polymerase sigma factor [Paenibacillus sp. J2TS4]|uniref:RNA polymerase sigma factor n=1 Tax=Paenibacillus sp. J2TS4 TaxID=2807194 RepID=UPI001B198499|nr:RNA polymerase sigma factor [Paenibacillus sp. J2TS4]GIP32552.1 ECF RNA polymerase sigma factor SigW [Paenibacillus sp. J2TS4]
MDREADGTSLSHADIELIVRQMKEGQSEQFRLLVNHYQVRLDIYCYHMLGNRQEAEDAVQEVLIKCYQHIGKYNRSISFTAWLYKIAYNHCINVLKKRSSWFKVLRLYRLQQLHTQFETDYNDVVGEMLGRLSSEERNLILLRAIDERSFDEIGQIIGCKAATARKKYERIKKKLKPLWSEMEGLIHEGL